MIRASVLCLIQISRMAQLCFLFALPSPPGFSSTNRKPDSHNFQILHASPARNYRLREKIRNIVIYNMTSNSIIYVLFQPTVNPNTISLSCVFPFFRLLSSFKLITGMHVWSANSSQIEQVTITLK